MTLTVLLTHLNLWDNMKFLLEDAVEIGIYEPIDYSKEEGNYCGEPITNNLLYDE